MVFATCSDNDSPTAPKSSVDNQEIVFLSDRTGTAELYVINADGYNLKRLASGADAYESPSWSPDGTEVLCARQTAGQWDICVLNPRGGSATLLAPSGSDDRNPVYSFDGSMIAFESWRDGDQEIYVMNADGTGLVRITNHPGIDRMPSWHPGGTMLTFASLDTAAGAEWAVCWINADGTGLVKPDISSAFAGCTSGWSANGLWFSTLSADKTAIMIFDAATLQWRASTVSQLGCDSPCWSPASAKILCTTTQSAGITRVLCFDFSGVQPYILWLTDNPAHDTEPSWSLDLSSVVFCSDRDGNREIYVMNADGSEQTRLTNSPGNDWAPRWRELE